jgi:hypothetical protein
MLEERVSLLNARIENSYDTSAAAAAEHNSFPCLDDARALGECRPIRGVRLQCRHQS